MPSGRYECQRSGSARAPGRRARRTRGMRKSAGCRGAAHTARRRRRARIAAPPAVHTHLRAHNAANSARFLHLPAAAAAAASAFTRGSQPSLRPPVAAVCGASVAMVGALITNYAAFGTGVESSGLRAVRTLHVQIRVLRASGAVAATTPH